MLPLEPSMNAIKDETLQTAEEMVFKTESTTKAKVIKLPGLFREFYRTSDNPVLSLTMRQNDVTRSLECSNYAPINVKPAGVGGGGRAWGGDLKFFKNLPSNSLPTGKLFQSNATKFPPPRAAHCYQISQGRT